MWDSDQANDEKFSNPCFGHDQLLQRCLVETLKMENLNDQRSDISFVFPACSSFPLERFSSHHDMEADRKWRVSESRQRQRVMYCCSRKR